MSPEEVRKKTAGQFQPTTNSIVFVVRDTNPDDNLNFQKLGDVSQDVPTNEAARRFFSEFQKQFPEIVKQQDPGAQLTAMQIIDLAGGVAFKADFFSMRGDTRMKQIGVIAA